MSYIGEFDNPKHKAGEVTEQGRVGELRASPLTRPELRRAADNILDRPSADPDDDPAILARFTIRYLDGPAMTARTEPSDHPLREAQQALASLMAQAGLAIPSPNRDEQWAAPDEEAASILGAMLAQGLVSLGPDLLRPAVIGAVTNHLRTGCEDTPKEDCAEAIWLDVESSLAARS